MDGLVALFADPAVYAALFTLVVMEVVLGIDNLVAPPQWTQHVQRALAPDRPRERHRRRSWTARRARLRDPKVDQGAHDHSVEPLRTFPCWISSYKGWWVPSPGGAGGGIQCVASSTSI